MWTRTPEDQLEAITDELDVLHRRQSQAERADIEGRVADRAAWLDAINERANRIRHLQRERDRLIAVEEAEAELREHHRQEEPS